MHAALHRDDSNNRYRKYCGVVQNVSQVSSVCWGPVHMHTSPLCISIGKTELLVFAAPACAHGGARSCSHFCCSF